MADYINSAGETKALWQIRELFPTTMIADGSDLSHLGWEKVTDTPPTEMTEAEMLAFRRSQMAVSALQGELAINTIPGAAAAFTNWIASLDPVVDFETLAFFHKAETWKRFDPHLIAGAAVLGLSDEQLDQLFEVAKSL